MASQDEQPALRTYRGNCHCKKLVFEVKLPEIKTAYSCNCSHCFKKGMLWNFPASPDDITWVKGSEADMTEYSFAKGELSHHFCPDCGIQLIGKRGGKTGAVNIRAIQGPPGEQFDLKALSMTPFDGAALEPKYTIPPNTVPAPTGEGTLYRGNCHCGGITWALKFKDLKTCDSKSESNFAERITECNCSMCQKGGYIWCYPANDPTQFALSGRENAGYYTFGSHIARKAFCKKCGVHVFAEANPDLSQEDIEKLPEPIKLFRERVLKIMPLNLRTMEDGELVRGLEIASANGWSGFGEIYQNP